jgi:phosphate starvation-inducible membrane PsiE
LSGAKANSAIWANDPDGTIRVMSEGSSTVRPAESVKLVVVLALELAALLLLQAVVMAVIDKTRQTASSSEIILFFMFFSSFASIFRHLQNHFCSSFSFLQMPMNLYKTLPGV